MKSRENRVRQPRSLRQTVVTRPTQNRALSGLALSLSTAMLLPASAWAQTAQPATTDARLPTVKVEASAIDPNPNAETGVPYKAKTSGDERHTRPLAETPQTIQVLTKKAIDESGYTDLKQILNAQPGITIGTGENGNAFGDRYIIRGQEARSDTFMDGLRDPGMTTRESFAIEQVEITKGANSTFSGRGTSGGSINAITKQPTLDYDFVKGTAAVGSDSHRRLTLDWNKVVNDTFAFRLNALYGYENVPDRSPADRDRRGLAFSALFKPKQDLDIVIDYYGMRAKDQADLGSFLDANLKPRRNTPVVTQDADFLDSDVDTLTARVTYRLSPDARVVSRTRYGTSNNDYALTAARGSTTGAGNPGGAYATITQSFHQGWQEVEYLAHQTNLLWNSKLGGLKHEFSAGFEYSDNKVRNGTYSTANTGAFNCVVGAGAVLNNYCFTNASGALVPNANNLLGRVITKGRWDQDWQVRTAAVTLMDTVDLTDKWTVFGGLRADHYKFNYSQQTGAGVLTWNNLSTSDTFFNGHVGVTYKISPAGMVYASVSSAADINGGESDVGANSTYGGVIIVPGTNNIGAKPERSTTLEIGTKWNVMDDKLLATAALFQTTKTDVMEGTGSYASTGSLNTGKNRVRGIEFGLVGNVTDKLSLQAGAAFMNAEILDSFNPILKGLTLSNFAKKSATIQAKYQFTEAFAIGGAAVYQGSRFGGQPDTAPNRVNATSTVYNRPVPSYTKYDLFATYRINKAAELRFNILNVTDKDHYLAVYQGGFFLYKGDARSYRMTLSYDFL